MKKIINAQEAASVIAREAVERVRALYAIERHAKDATAEGILEADFDSLRDCGFSGRKIQTIHEIASGSLNSLVSGQGDADKISDEDLIPRLVTLKGVGRSAVEMFPIYILERMDVLSADYFEARESKHYREKTSCEAAGSPKW